MNAPEIKEGLKFYLSDEITGSKGKEEIFWIGGIKGREVTVCWEQSQTITPYALKDVRKWFNDGSWILYNESQPPKP